MPSPQIKNTMKRFSFSIALSFFFIACTKHTGDLEVITDPSGASIVFASPTAGALYQSSDSISIQATAIAPAVIHGYDIIIKKPEDTTVLYKKHIHDHNDTLLISQKWKPAPAQAGELEAKIVLVLDHDGHTAAKSVAFKVQ
jgi:hypothetical protein